MELQQALHILQLSVIPTEPNVARLRRKAQRRWHPDQIAHANPSESTRQRYTENFQGIDEAIKTLLSYVHPPHPSTATRSHARSTTTTVGTGHRSSRSTGISIPQMQQEVSDALATKRLGVTVSTQILANGVSVKEALDRDVHDNLLEAVLLNWYGFSMACVILAIIAACIGSAMLWLGELLSRLLLAMWLIQSGASFLALLPLSRLWLPPQVADVMLALVNVGRECYLMVVQFGSGCFIVGLMLFPILFAKLFLTVLKVFLVLPLYWLIGQLWGTCRIGVIKRTTRSVAGVEERNLRRILLSDPTQVGSADYQLLEQVWLETQKG